VEVTVDRRIFGIEGGIDSGPEDIWN